MTLLQSKLQIKVIKFTNRLKKLFPVSDTELEEMRTRRQATTTAPLHQLSSLSRKIGRDYGNIDDNYTEEADFNESHSDFQGLEPANSHAEQSTPIYNTEARAKVKHPEEDNVEFLDAVSQAKIFKKSKKKSKVPSNQFQSHPSLTGY